MAYKFASSIFYNFFEGLAFSHFGFTLLDLGILGEEEPFLQHLLLIF